MKTEPQTDGDSNMPILRLVRTSGFARTRVAVGMAGGRGGGTATAQDGSSTTAAACNGHIQFKVQTSIGTAHLACA